MANRVFRRNYLAELQEDVAECIDKCDQVFQRYNEKTKSNRERFQERAFQEEQQHLKVQLMPELESAKMMAKQCIMDSCNAMREDLKTWVRRPADRELIETIRICNEFKMNLSSLEIEMMIDKAVPSYFSLHMLSDLAKQNGYQMNELVTVKEFLSKIDTIEKSTISSLENYSGFSQEGISLTNADRTLATVSISFLDSILREDDDPTGSEIDDIRQMLTADYQTLGLTQERKSEIDRILVNAKHDTDKIQAIIKASKDDKKLLDDIDLDDEYQPYAAAIQNAKSRIESKAEAEQQKYADALSVAAEKTMERLQSKDDVQ